MKTIALLLALLGLAGIVAGCSGGSLPPGEWRGSVVVDKPGTVLFRMTSGQEVTIEVREMSNPIISIDGSQLSMQPAGPNQWSGEMVQEPYIVLGVQRNVGPEGETYTLTSADGEFFVPDR